MADEIRCALEIREDTETRGPGRLTGVLMPYGVKASDRPEMFEAGSLTWDPAGFNINAQHNRMAAVVRVLPFEHDGKVMIDQPLPNTTAGRDAAENLKPGGIYRGLSVEFRATRETRRNGLRLILAGVLTGGALVDTPSYTAATVEVREGLDSADYSLPSGATLWL